VAVCVGEGALCCCADVRKDEIRACLASETLEVLAVPGRDRGCKDAGLWTEFGVRVEAYTEAIAVDWTAVVLLELALLLNFTRRVDVGFPYES
jgi:hypothetical protein